MLRRKELQRGNGAIQGVAVEVGDLRNALEQLLGR